jgi:hypothetical protein
MLTELRRRCRTPAGDVSCESASSSSTAAAALVLGARSPEPHAADPE